MKKNDYFEGECVDLTHEGQGIVKVEGMPYFVKGMLVGERGKLKVIKQLKNYGIARLIELTVSSSLRCMPRCPIYKQCGGCHLQHLSLEGQQQFKQKRVQDVMKRIGKINVSVNPTLMPENPWFYRNKVQVPVGYVKNQLEMGFYKQHSNDIIPMEKCYIQNEMSNKITKRVKELMQFFNIEPYDKIKGRGLVRHILTKYGFKTDELMLVLITNGKKFPYKEKFISILTNEFPNLKTIIQNINERKDNVILGEEEIIWQGKGYIQDELNGLLFNISSKSFYQINPPQVEVLYNTAIQLANLQKDQVVIDAYCGIGTISLSMAKHVKKVIGVEIVKEAIEDAKRNAKINHIDNVEFLVDDAGHFMKELAKKGESVDVVMVDPPRKGCSKEFLEALAILRPKQIVYISCDPSTQARDVHILDEYGYQVDVLQPVDLFSHTYHIENIARFSLKGGENHE